MEQKIKDAISLSIILGPILVCVFAIANAYFYYTMINYNATTTAPIPSAFSTESFVNDTVKPSNITTVLQNVSVEDDSLIVTFNHTSSQQGLEIDYFQCTIDNTNWGECSSPYVLRLSDFDMNSNHTLEIRAVDMEGNIETNPVAILFPIDMAETVK